MLFVPYNLHKSCNSLDCSVNKTLPNIWSFEFTPANTTYLTFKQWLPLYQADPEGWHYGYTYLAYKKTIILPYYIKVNEEGQREGDKPQIIKFPKRKDFRRWRKFVIKEYEKGLDFENLQEYQMLLISAQSVADRRVREAQKQVQAQYNDILQLVEKSTNSVFDGLKQPIEIKKQETKHE